MSTVIKAESLGKKYVLHHEQPERYMALRDVIARKAKGMARSVISPFLRGQSNNGNNGKREDLWALRDVSFEIKQGETVGIIGRNGAGKSTLLKILSRITEPTQGRVTLRGRVASLLEVGTGFHPELTGRENIYLNGAILGMTKAEIRGKFDEIVDFAEIEKFLDTPVKRYSSGMYVRLAFAVAAHLEPEILLVDEVLAVGDSEFQKKCLGKMDKVTKEGRTILFVSHNMSAIRLLCSSVITMRKGRLTDCGDTGTVIPRYLSDSAKEAEDSSCGPRGLYLESVVFTTPGGEQVDTIPCGEGGVIHISYDLADKTIHDAIVTIGLYDIYGTRISTLSNLWASDQSWQDIKGEGTIVCEIPAIPIAPGRLFVNVAIDGYCDLARFHDDIVSAFSLTVIPSDYWGTARMPATVPGSLVLKQSWTLGARSHR